MADPGEPPGFPASALASPIIVVRPRSGSNRFPSAPAPKLPPAPRPADDNFSSIVTPLRSSTTPAPKSPLIVPTESRRGSAPSAASLLNPRPIRSSPLAQQSTTAESLPVEPADLPEPTGIPPLPPLDPPPEPPASTSPPPSASTISPPNSPAVAPISISAFLPPPVSPGKIAVSKIPVNRPAGPTSPPSQGKAYTETVSPVLPRLNTLLRTQSMAGPGVAPPVLNSKGEVIAAFSGTNLNTRLGLDQRSSSMSAEAPPPLELPPSPRQLGASLSSRELGYGTMSNSAKSPLSHREGGSTIDTTSPRQKISVLFGSAPLAALLPTPPPAPVGKPASSQRSFVINELLKTERDYIADLELVQTVFYKPLMERKILSPKDILALFSNIEQIKDVNRTLLKNIEDCMKNTPNLEEVQLGETFLRLADFLKVYTSYLQNQKIASDTMIRCEQQIPAFAAFLKECMADPRCRGLSFLSFLIKPTQRISKYPLLLKELTKNTPEDHADYQSLQKALKRIEEIVTYLNERKRETENQQQILEIQSKLKADKAEETSLVSPGRRLILEGSLTLLTPDMKEQIPRKLFLFNDLFVAVKVEGSGKNEKFLVRGWFMLDSIKVVNHADTPTHKNLFGIERGSDMLVFLCSGEEEKTKWLKNLRDLVKTFQRKAFKSAAGKD